MIIGIGCDIVDIRRFQTLIDKYNDKFTNKIFTIKEINVSKLTNSTSYFAKRFAVKEAYAKASGYAIGKKIKFRAIEILNDINGKPFFNKHPLSNEGVRALVSISDEIPYAIAYVILERL